MNVLDMKVRGISIRVFPAYTYENQRVSASQIKKLKGNS